MNINASENAVQSVMDEIDDDFVNSLVVTPKDIDSLVENISTCIAKGINKAFETENFV